MVFLCIEFIQNLFKSNYFAFYRTPAPKYHMKLAQHRIDSNPYHISSPSHNTHATLSNSALNASLFRFATGQALTEAKLLRYQIFSNF